MPYTEWYSVLMATQHTETPRYAVEYLAAAPWRGQLDLDDLPWQRINGHDDYATPGDAAAAADEFDAAFDGEYVHRVVRGAQ